MADKRVWTWTARLAALLVAVVIPACNNSGAGGAGNSQGILWSSGTTQGGGVVTPTGSALWVNPNLAVLGPIGIIGIGGVELTYADADPIYINTPEGPHPVSTSRSLDPNAEAIVNSMVQQLFQPNVNQGGGGQVVVGPNFLTGDAKLGAIARAHAKHGILHAGAVVGAPLAQRLNWVNTNPNRVMARDYETFTGGQGMTPTQAGNTIAGAAAGYVASMTVNTFGASGYWTGGIDNYYNFTAISVANGAP